MCPERTEDDVPDLLMKVLYGCVGAQGSWQGEGMCASFDITNRFGSAHCRAERALEYKLPAGGTLSHKADILISMVGGVGETGARHVALEVKHLSAVTDAFKGRAYDMLHLKQTFGTQLLGILVYFRANIGLPLRQAEKISYPYDHFISIEYSKILEAGSLEGVVRTVAKEIGVTLPSSAETSGGARSAS